MGFLSFLSGPLFVFLVGLSSWFLGRRLMPRYAEGGHPFINVAACAVLGLLAESSVLHFLIHFGWIQKRMLWLWLGLLVWPAFLALVHLMQQGDFWKKLFGSMPGLLFISFTFFYYVWTALAAALPATAVDELAYHLAVPKQILEAGKWRGFPNNIYAYFPSAADRFFLLALGTAGESAARMMHALWGALTVLALYGFSRKYASRWASFCACLLWMSIPSVIVIQSWAYVDLAYGLCVLLSLIFLIRAFETRSESAFILCGLMMGTAITVKYTGLQTALIFAILMILDFRDRKKFFAFNTYIVFFACMILPGIPDLVRNWSDTGWPLFPFRIPGFDLHAEMNWGALRAQYFTVWLNQFGTPLGGNAVMQMLSSPFAVFVTARFRVIESFDGVIGPVFLLIFLFIPRLWRRSEMKPLLIWAGLFFYFWTSTTKQVRFLLPVMPVLCLLLAAGLQNIRATWKNVLGFIYVASMLAWGVSEVGHLRPLDYWRGRESREQFLSSRAPAYSAYREAASQLTHRDRLYLLNMKNYGYWLDAGYESDFVFERWTLDACLRNAQSGKDVFEFFKSKNVSHLLTDRSVLSSESVGILPDAAPVWQDFLNRYTQLEFERGPYGFYRLKS